MTMYPAYAEFLQLTTRGLRDQANEKVQEVIRQYEDRPDPRFAYRLIEDRKGGRVNYSLYARIVFPVLHEGYRNDDVNAMTAMVKTVQNIYQDKAIHEELKWITDAQLLRRILSHDPRNEWAREEYMRSQLHWLDYCIHEWPSGILYGQDGANISECDEIIEAVEELRVMDRENKYSRLLNDVECKTRQYRERLAHQ